VKNYEEEEVSTSVKKKKKKEEAGCALQKGEKWENKLRKLERKGGNKKGV
jgi:hypothetical protein